MFAETVVASADELTAALDLAWSTRKCSRSSAFFLPFFPEIAPYHSSDVASWAVGLYE